MAEWKPTNANDVTLIVSEVDRSGDSPTTNGLVSSSGNVKNTHAVVVDDFSMGSEEDMDALSGIGNPEALGISQGDVDHSFSFTIQGEDAELFNALASSDGTANELQIVVKMQAYKDKMTGAYAGTRNLSGSSGDPTEFEVEGIATNRDSGTLSEGEGGDPSA